jgi:prohibitin 1
MSHRIGHRIQSTRPRARGARAALALAALAALAALPGCAIVRQDQVGVRRTLGKVNGKTLGPGAKAVVPGVTSIVRVPSRTVNREVALVLPSKEGLNIEAEVSILYRITPEMAARILETSGQQYEEVVILPVFRSAAADVTARFLAKDMYSGERTQIERSIQQQMTSVLGERGFVIERVLLKSIRLPAGLARAVEAKLEAEQQAEQMRFVLERERQEAERKKIEAEGVRDAQTIVGSGLTDMLIRFKSIEAFRELARAQTSTVIVTDGRAPFLIAPPEGRGAAAAADAAPRAAAPPAAAPRARPRDAMSSSGAGGR